MALAIHVFTDGSRVIVLAGPRERGSLIADELANAPCGRCRQPIGLETPFHEVHRRLYHAACIPLPGGMVHPGGGPPAAPAPPDPLPPAACWTPPAVWGLRVGVVV